MSSDIKSKSHSDTQTHKLPAAKLNALSRLKSFGSSLKPQAKPSPIIFPPPSWELTEDLLNPYANKSAPALSESNFEEATPIIEPPEPLSLAQRIKALIEALPIPGVSSSPGNSATEAVAQNAEQNTTSPIPQGMDDSLVRLLSSEDVMNGSQSNQSPGGSSRPGIWNVLSGLKNGDDSASLGSSSVEEDVDSGVMMYAPLQPQNDSQVELATSETVREYIEESQGQSSSTTGGSIDSTPAQGKEKQVWVPSTTQLSLFTTWWGYRIYLPPPVMEQLDKSSLKATARAAMITSALKWMIDKIPLMLIPPQFRAAVKMLKQLAPVVSYVGVFIAWSWDRIRSYDKGNGVVLTATWLLPVALLPMTWDAGDIQGPRIPKDPAEQDKSAQSAEPMTPEPVAEPSPPPKEEKKKHFFKW
ncbi:hypothetical protein BJ165DRAFT_1521965 [Panaeolus papilionaceus]|nr:hypothetical protein BJ165DRAFT_1521965 [Panaeolus papilionaceus]